MPAHDRVWPNHARQPEEARPAPCHPDHECSISAAQLPTPRSLLHRDIELIAQIQVLDLKPAPRLEPIEGKSKEQVKQGKHHEHHDGGCADSLSDCQAPRGLIFREGHPSACPMFVRTAAFPLPSGTMAAQSITPSNSVISNVVTRLPNRHYPARFTASALSAATSSLRARLLSCVIFLSRSVVCPSQQQAQTTETATAGQGHRRQTSVI